MNLLAPLSRRPVQVALPLTGIGKEGFIRFDNALQVFGFAVGGQDEELILPSFSGHLVCE
jgi:hypothetical protein